MIIDGALLLPGEFWRKFAVNFGDMHAHFLEQAATHHAHHAAALILALRPFGALPLRAGEAGGLTGIEFGVGLFFQRLETGDDPGRQFLEPGAGGLFAGFDAGSRGFPWALGF